MIQHIKDVTLRSLGADMTMTRWTIAIASLACGVFLLGPQQYFDLQGYRLMNDFMSAVCNTLCLGKVSPEDLYGGLFVLHFVLAMWRIYDPDPRPRWSLAVNILGFVLVFTLGLSVDLSLGRFTLLSGIAFALSWVAFWNIVRTANGAQEVGP